MKKQFLALLVLAFLITACGEESEGGLPSLGRSANTLTSVTLIGARYYEKTEEGYEEKGSISRRDGVEVLKDSTIEVVSIGDQNVRVLPVLIDGKTMFINAFYLLPGQQLAVIRTVEPASLKKGTGPLDNTTFILPRGTVVGFDPASEEEGQVRVVAHSVPQEDGKNEFFGTWGTWYVRKSHLSTQKADLELVDFLAQLPNTPKATWEANLRELRRKYGSSVFVKEVDELLAEITVPAQEAAPVVDEQWEEDPFVMSFEVSSPNVILRETPSLNSQNLGALVQGEVVSVTKKTSQMASVDGVRDYWLFVEESSEGLQGWVFGANLTAVLAQ